MKLSDILKASGNKYASLASDGLEGSDTDTYIQTGSFAFNALLSGSLYGGIPDNKIIALAGEQATGKTYFAMNNTSYNFIVYLVLLLAQVNNCTCGVFQSSTSTHFLCWKI